MQRQREKLPKIHKLRMHPASCLTAADVIEEGFTYEDTGFLYQDLRCCKNEKGFQTDFHDADVQTKPWTPPFTKSPLPDQELVYLKDFHTESDLPAGECQLDALSIFRERSKWEASYLLPGQKDEIRERKIKETRIWEMFHSRGKEMQQIHEDHMKRFKDELNKRRNYLHKRNNLRLQHIWAIKKKEIENLQLNISQKHTHNVHVIEHRRDHLYPARKKLDVIKQYSDFTSQVYAAPMSSHIEQYREFNMSKYLNTLDGLVELETNLMEVCKEQVGPAKRMSMAERRALRFFKSIQDFKFTKVTSLQDIGDQKKDSSQEKRRQQTPTVSMMAIREVRKIYAGLILKKMLRGRAAQCRMMKEREQNRELIDELHSTIHVCIAEEEEVKRLIASTQNVIDQESSRYYTEIVRNEFLRKMNGVVLIEVVTFLANSQLRHLEEYFADINALSQEEISEEKSEELPAMDEISKYEDESLEIEEEEAEGEEKEAAVPGITAAMLYLSPEQIDIAKYFHILRCRKKKEHLAAEKSKRKKIL